MKHDIEFPIDHFRQRDLPDAPLAMPRQVIERRFAWSGVFRLFGLVRLSRG